MSLCHPHRHLGQSLWTSLLALPATRPWSDGKHPTPGSMAVGSCWMSGGTTTLWVSVSQTPACLLVCLQPETPIGSPSPEGCFLSVCLSLSLSLLLLCSDGICWKLAPSVPLQQIGLKQLNKRHRKGESWCHRKTEKIDNRYIDAVQEKIS